MSCFSESENCKYELNKSTSSLVDVSLSTPIPPQSSSVKKSVVPLSSEILLSSSSSSSSSSSVDTKQPQQYQPLQVSLNSSVSTTSSDGSFVLNKINDESKASIGDSQITLSTPPEPSAKSKNQQVDDTAPPCVMMNIGESNTSSILNQSLMRSVNLDLDESESKQNWSADHCDEEVEECKIFEEGDEPPQEVEEEGDEEQEETEEERIKRENEESERLAWELMQEEQNAAYQAQVDFLNQNATNFSDEDRAALALVMEESANVLQQNITATRAGSQDETEDGEEDEEEEEEDDEQAWTGGEHYERLLELGNVLGDVKTERWRLRADSIISELPTVTYKQIEEDHSQHVEVCTTATPSTTGSGEKKRKVVRTLDVKCSVCMDPYEGSDELKLLPACQHYFHVDCAKGWLKDNNSCPICKIKVTTSPEK